MKIDNQDIIRMARQLRDEENAQLDVCPWTRHRRFRFPVWLAAIPAASIAGFVLGLWTQAHTQSDTPMSALVDTVYIKVPIQQPPQDTVAQVILNVPAPAAKPAIRRAKPSRRQESVVGCPVADDHIRYDLLVKN